MNNIEIENMAKKCVMQQKYCEAMDLYHSIDKVGKVEVVLEKAMDAYMAGNISVDKVLEKRINAYAGGHTIDDIMKHYGK